MKTDDIVATLLAGKIVVIRTDTIYGIIARVSDKEAVEKVYRIKQRESNKQCIVLIADSSSVAAHADVIEQISSSAKLPTSVVVPVSDEPAWITRGGDSVAYRVVRSELLRQIIEQVGPVIAPSTNPEGKPPAKNIAEAEKYFGDSVDLYVDGGEVPRTIQASQIIRIKPDGSIDHLR